MQRATSYSNIYLLSFFNLGILFFREYPFCIFNGLLHFFVRGSGLFPRQVVRWLANLRNLPCGVNGEVLANLFVGLCIRSQVDRYNKPFDILISLNRLCYQVTGTYGTRIDLPTKLVFL